MTSPQRFVYRAIVTRVIDGDSFLCDIDLGLYVWLREQRIRLAGVDAPETKEPHGQEIADKLREWVQGKEITLVTKRDRKEMHGRWLGTIYMGEICVNNKFADAVAKLLAEGNV